MTEKWSADPAVSAQIAALEENYKIVTENIAQAAQKAGRNPQEITLLAATKTVPAPVINRAIELGITCIGENKVQEFCEKYEQLNLANCDCHFIGRLQTNKVKYLIGKVSAIHSVDSVKLAQEISRLSQKQNTVTQVLVQINIGREESKGGIYLEDTEKFLLKIANFPGISVQGLMTIPPATANIPKINQYFENMYKKSVDIAAKKLDNITINSLSMGMSADYTQAIACGATIVRLGSALFGQRIYT